MENRNGDEWKEGFFRDAGLALELMAHRVMKHLGGVDHESVQETERTRRLEAVADLETMFTVTLRDLHGAAIAGNEEAQQSMIELFTETGKDTINYCVDELAGTLEAQRPVGFTIRLLAAAQDALNEI